MSVALAGMFGDRQWTSDSLVRVSRYLDRVCPGEDASYVGDGIALLQRSVRPSANDAAPQVLITARQAVYTWHGRLDNRRELLIKLASDLGATSPDVAIAGAVYERWGTDGLGNLIGDWSLAAWDEPTRTLTLACDYAGIRSLYYAEHDGVVHWSSSLSELVLRLDRTHRLEPRFAAGYLTATLVPTLTPYVGIASVPVAHAVTWSAQGRRHVDRFWSPPIDRLRYADPRDYDVALRALLTESVASRLHSPSPVWAELSGGLDSSSIVCIADRVRDESPEITPALRTISFVSDDSPESDERRFIRAIEQSRESEGHYVIAEKALHETDQTSNWVSPLHPGGLALAIARRVREAGGHVLLTGRFGDSVMANRWECLDGIIGAAAEHRIADALRLARQWCLASQRPVWQLAGCLAAAWAPAHYRWRQTLRSTLRPFGVDGLSLAEAASEAFHLTPPLAEMWCDDALIRAQRLDGYRHTGRYDAIADVVDTCEQRWLETPPELPVTWTHPFSHRPLVEFMLRVPSDIGAQPGQPRRLMRSALANVVPKTVLNRFSKGYLDPVLLRHLRESTMTDARPVSSWHVVEAGYVDAPQLQRMIRSLHAGSCRRLKNMELVMRLERWLRARQSINYV